MASLRRDGPRSQLLVLLVAPLRLAAKLLSALVGVLILGLGWLSLLVAGDRRGERPRLLWGTTPIKSLTYLSRAMREAGHESDVAVVELYSITSRDDFDCLVFSERFSTGVIGQIASSLKAYVFLARALRHYDVFHYYFDGGLLRLTPLVNLEIPYLRRCGKRIVLLPYGSDAFVYDHVGDLTWRALLMIDYATRGDQALAIERRLRRWSRRADVVVGCLVHIACLPRWDVLPLTCYPIDTDALTPRYPSTDGPIKIVHPTNHRGTKGTEFVMEAVRQLREDGHEIELVLIEMVPNAEALELIASADLFIDQLLFGYALAALEGLALGKVVISGIEDTAAYTPFRRYSYLNECPIIGAGPETLHAVITELIERRGEWPEIGRRSRLYAERRHSLAAARELYGAIYKKIWDGESIDLINFYHPLFERDRASLPAVNPTTDAPRA